MENFWDLMQKNHKMHLIVQPIATAAARAASSFGGTLTALSTVATTRPCAIAPLTCEVACDGGPQSTRTCETCEYPNVINALSTSCNACPAGQGPNVAQTACSDCSVDEYSTIGICQQCAEGTECDSRGEGADSLLAVGKLF